MSSVRISHRLCRFRFLLWSLMMIIGLRPLLEDWIGTRIWADVFTDIFFGFALLSGLHAVKGQPRQLRLSMLLVSGIVLLSMLHYMLKSQIFFRWQQGFSGVFLLQMLAMILIHIEKENEVTLDLIMASACAYILIGMVWAYFYHFVEVLHPKSFTLPWTPGDDLWDFYYYSFVTLTTVGYGDIVALTKPARALSILEALTGQLYLAIMISRLVGLHASQSGAGRGK
jgi:hypothetical protein